MNDLFDDQSEKEIRQYTAELSVLFWKAHTLQRLLDELCTQSQQLHLLLADTIQRCIESLDKDMADEKPLPIVWEQVDTL